MILHPPPCSVPPPRKECADMKKKVHSSVQFKYFNIETNFEGISVEKYSKQQLKGKVRGNYNFTQYSEMKFFLRSVSEHLHFLDFFYNTYFNSRAVRKRGKGFCTHFAVIC